MKEQPEQSERDEQKQSHIVSLQDYKIERKLLRRGMVIKKDPEHNIRMVLRLRHKDSKAHF